MPDAPRQVNFRLTLELARALDAEAERTGQTISEICRVAAALYLTGRLVAVPDPGQESR